MDSSEDGQLQVIIGPMFSGKTSELIRRIQRFHLASYRCLIIKYTHCNILCSKTTIVSHDGHSLPGVLAVCLKDLEKAIQEFDVIGIDDGHSFSDLQYFCEKMSDIGKVVIVAGLDSCEKEAFQQILNIIPFAEAVTKLTAICMSCTDEAPLTKAISPEKDSTGSGRYISVCVRCFEKPEQSFMSPFKNYISKKTLPVEGQAQCLPVGVGGAVGVAAPGRVTGSLSPTPNTPWQALLGCTAHLSKCISITS